jgi:hypothetical protein
MILDTSIVLHFNIILRICELFNLKDKIAILTPVRDQVSTISICWIDRRVKYLNQGFLLVKLKSSLRKFYSRRHDLVDRYGISMSQMSTDIFRIHLRLHNFIIL